jgi:sugar phosphate isomerase/epimerase
MANLAGMDVRRIQLALDPLIDKPEWNRALELLAGAEIEVVSGMFGTGAEDYTTPATIRATGGLFPDDSYEKTLARIPRYIALLDQLQIDKISFHTGFIPHDDAGGLRAKMLQRLAVFADRFGEAGKLLLLETGQETAETLVGLLTELDRPNLKVNFDPGNLLLYSMGDPIKALRILLPYIAQIHIKDAIASGDPEVWGAEQPAGEGSVDWRSFFAILAEADYSGNLVIERECGNDPVGEIRRAITFLSGILQ